jgi:hypothetical protein
VDRRGEERRGLIANNLLHSRGNGWRDIERGLGWKCKGRSHGTRLAGTAGCGASIAKR